MPFWVAQGPPWAVHSSVTQAFVQCIYAVYTVAPSVAWELSQLSVSKCQCKWLNCAYHWASSNHPASSSPKSGTIPSYNVIKGREERIGRMERGAGRGKKRERLPLTFMADYCKNYSFIGSISKLCITSGYLRRSVKTLVTSSVWGHLLDSWKREIFLKEEGKKKEKNIGSNRSQCYQGQIWIESARNWCGGLVGYNIHMVQWQTCWRHQGTLRPLAVGSPSTIAALQTQLFSCTTVQSLNVTPCAPMVAAVSCRGELSKGGVNSLDRV